SPTLSRETSMFVVVMAAGALGAVVHVLRSFYWYVGNRALRRSWLVMYLLLPFVGALLGLIVYLVLRGGLTSPAGGASDVNPYGVTAIAALVGLFSRETSEKLRSVFATLLSHPPSGRDQALPPRVSAVEPGAARAAPWAPPPPGRGRPPPPRAGAAARGAARSAPWSPSTAPGSARRPPCGSAPPSRASPTRPTRSSARPSLRAPRPRRPW